MCAISMYHWRYHKRLVAWYMDWHINQNYSAPLTGNWCALTRASSDILAVTLSSAHWIDNDELKYLPVNSVMQSQNVVKISQSSLRSFFYICAQDTWIAKEREGFLKLLHRNLCGEKNSSNHYYGKVRSNGKGTEILSRRATWYEIVSIIPMVTLC